MENAPPAAELLKQTTSSQSTVVISTGSSSSSTLVTSLPSAPVDGDQCILVDSVTAPTYQWQFRYNGKSVSTYKWECIGAGGALEGTTTITIPNAGDWFIEVGAAGASFGALDSVRIALTAGGVTLGATQGAGGGGTENVYGSAYDKARATALTAAQVLTPTVTLGGAGAVTRQYIRATPVRVI